MVSNDLGIEDSELEVMGFTKEEIKKIREYERKGMTLAEAIKKLGENKNFAKSKNPVETAMAETMSKISDIAISRIDNGSGTPIFLVNAGGKQAQGDLNTVIQFLQEVMEKYGKKESNKELEDVKKEIADLKELLAERDKEKEKTKIEELEAKIDNKIAQLQDTLRTGFLNTGEGPDIGQLFTILNENGTLNQILKITEQYLNNRSKQIDLQRNMSLFDKAVILANQVKDVDKITKLLKVLKEVTKSEENIEVVPEESEKE